MANKDQKHYPLQIAISTLFIFITVILGTIVSLQNYNKTSDIILSSADKVYTQIAKELYLDFKATYAPMAGTLQLLGQSPITQSKTLEERLGHLKTFELVLKSNASHFAVNVAFPDGDFFSTTLLDNPLSRQHFNAPENAELLAMSVETDKQGLRNMLRIFYDNNLQEISRNSVETGFDPLQRSWYKQAAGAPQATKPYLFYETGALGLTAMLKAPQPGVVIAIDVTLNDLAETVSRYQITPSSEIVLINADGETFAYKDPESLIIKSDGKQLELAGLNQLGSDVLAYLSKDLESVEQNIDFEFDGRRWVGSSRIVARPGGVDLFALMLTPVDELLAEATAIHRQSLVTTIVIILLFIPVIWLASRKISNPLKRLAKDAEKVTRFDFDGSSRSHTFIKEVGELDNAVDMMRSTINKFISLIRSLAGEQDLDALLKSITRETKLISKADGALTYLLDETDNMMKPAILFGDDSEPVATDLLPEVTIEDSQYLTDATSSKLSNMVRLGGANTVILDPLLKIMGVEELYVLIIPLTNRNNETIGLLCMIYKQKADPGETRDASIAFVEALSGFAAVTLEGRQMLNMQEALLSSFIKLIAGAIDSKSPYTGGHCQRVPEITFMLARAACDSNDPKFKDFALTAKQWKELEIACWLHDCGKVTTPEYVVDKSTKLETIYDRIHEVRMRFEVLKRDAELKYWQRLAEGGDEKSLREILDHELQELDEDFSFIAECNEGGEFMADERIERLNNIAERTWMRTLDDRIGISWEELDRKTRVDKPALPVEERLLTDKPEHIIKRADQDRMPDDNPWNFRLDTPEHKYNRGELYNLSIRRGTLSDEERFKINEHMVQTIIMLNKLPYPRHMKHVPDIAGCHHETLDGKGYPKRLVKEQTPVTGRMMAIADIFEALTAADRPYKKAKTLNESIRILSFMKKDNHIDPDLFDLFLTSGAYLEYARKFLDPGQIDEVDINEYIAH